ncbi:MAG: DUF3710 domain-containing protein [Actinomycetota bacterium]|nr:DUF3710 domain-containing protein [Actinomycetota bacterium]
MGIFRRNRRDEDIVAVTDPDTDSASDAGTEAIEDREDAEAGANADLIDAVDAVDAVDADNAVDAVEDSRNDEDEIESFSRARGPFDLSEVQDVAGGDDRIDLGALRLTPLEGMQLRLELDEDQQSVVSAHAMLGDSGVQLQVFAAPRTTGVWPDIRTEIADSVTSQGGTAEVVDGPLGRELVARIPSRGSDGRTIQNPVRFLGVDGPRWFLRGVISGAAATDGRKAAPLVELFRSAVVVRDDQARPPRELLPLQVPAQPTVEGAENGESSENAENGDAAGESSGSGDATAQTGDDGASRNADDLLPFERGPEITEVR